MNLNQETKTKNVWYQKGQEPIIEAKRKGESINFYGALNMKTGQCSASKAGRQNSQTTILKKYIGKNLKTNLLLCESGVSSNYIAKKELDRYCRYIANLVIKENKIAKKWAKDTILTAEQLFIILKRLNSKKLNLANLLDLKEKFYLHIPPHFSMKKVVDYLPSARQKRLMPELVKARLTTENLFNN